MLVVMTSSSPASLPASRARSGRRPDLATDLRITVQQLSRRIRSEADPGDLTEAQYSVLAGLRHHGPSTPGTIADREGVQPPTMTRTLAFLEKAGLVVRSAHPTDGRQVVIELSTAGSDLVKETRRRRNHWMAQHLLGLGPEEQATLRDAVAILRRVMEP